MMGSRIAGSSLGLFLSQRIEQTIHQNILNGDDVDVSSTYDRSVEEIGTGFLLSEWCELISDVALASPKEGAIEAPLPPTLWHIQRSILDTLHSAGIVSAQTFLNAKRDIRPAFFDATIYNALDNWITSTSVHNWLTSARDDEERSCFLEFAIRKYLETVLQSETGDEVQESAVFDQFAREWKRRASSNRHFQHLDTVIDSYTERIWQAYAPSLPSGGQGQIHDPESDYLTRSVRDAIRSRRLEHAWEQIREILRTTAYEVRSVGRISEVQPAECGPKCFGTLQFATTSLYRSRAYSMRNADCLNDPDKTHCSITSEYDQSILAHVNRQLGTGLVCISAFGGEGKTTMAHQVLCTHFGDLCSENIQPVPSEGNVSAPYRGYIHLTEKPSFYYDPSAYTDKEKITAGDFVQYTSSLLSCCTASSNRIKRYLEVRRHFQNRSDALVVLDNFETVSPVDRIEAFQVLQDLDLLSDCLITSRYEDLEASLPLEGDTDARHKPGYVRLDPFSFESFRDLLLSISKAESSDEEDIRLFNQLLPEESSEELRVLFDMTRGNALISRMFVARIFSLLDDNFFEGDPFSSIVSDYEEEMASVAASPFDDLDSASVESQGRRLFEYIFYVEWKKLSEEEKAVALQVGNEIRVRNGMVGIADVLGEESVASIISFAEHSPYVDDSVFPVHREERPSADPPDWLSSAIEGLASSPLVDVEKKTSQGIVQRFLNMHPLVQDFTRLIIN